MKILTIILLSIILSGTLFFLKIPYIYYVSTDLANFLTSAYVNQHTIDAFKEDYILKWGSITHGNLYNFLFRGDFNRLSLHELLRADVIRKIANLSYFFLFLGCFLITSRHKDHIPLGIILIFLFTVPLHGYFERWHIHFNAFGYIANYFNCFVPLFLFYLIRFPDKSIFPILFILVFANVHPTSMMAFSFASLVFYFISKRRKQCVYILIAAMVSLLLAALINARGMADKFNTTPELAEFLAIRKGPRNFIFSWDNTTIVPIKLKSYLYIISHFLKSYWIIFVTPFLFALVSRFKHLQFIITSEIKFLFYTASILPLLAALVTFINRAILLTNFIPAIFNIESIRIERLSWPFFILGCFYISLSLYERHKEKIKFKKTLLWSTAIFLCVSHFSFSKMEILIWKSVYITFLNKVKKNTGTIYLQDAKIQNGELISKEAIENFEVMKELSSKGYSNIYAPDNNSLNEYLRLGTMKAVYFSIEDGILAAQLGNKVIEEWLRRYRLVSETDYSDNKQIKHLLDSEADLNGLLLPYDAKRDRYFRNTKKIGDYILILDDNRTDDL